MSGEDGSWHLVLEVGDEEVSNAIDTVLKDYLVMEVTEEGSRGSIRLLCDDVFDNVVGSINSSQDGVIVHGDGFAPCLTSGHGNCPKIVEIYEAEDTAGDK